MAGALDVALGMSDNGFTSGMRQAEEATKSLEKTLNRQLQSLTRQRVQMEGNADQLRLNRLAEMGATDAQIASVRALQQSTQQEQRAIAAARERQQRINELAAAENKRQTSIKSLLQNIRAEEAAVGNCGQTGRDQACDRA